MSLVPKGVSLSVGRALLKTKKNSPHIFFAAGVAGVLTSTVLACRATLRLSEDLDEIKKDFEAVTDMSGYDKLAEHSEPIKYTQAKYRRDVSYVYVKGAAKIGKRYAPALVVGGLSIASLSGAHIQLNRRNAALTATLATVSKAFEGYRVRIMEELGEDREREIYHDAVEETIQEDGKNKKVQVLKPGYSPYARIFEEDNIRWENDDYTNQMFLRATLAHWNHRLRSRGHVFLNEVYNDLGFDHTPEGSVVGWLYESEEGDSYISFGPLESDWAGNFLLDFNVDGTIFDRI